MPTIDIVIRDKRAVSPREARIVCDNSDYSIAFDFDAEWSEYPTKTARFIWGGRYIDKVFTGNVVAVPVITGAAFCAVGVYAGDIRTTTPARIPVLGSVRSAGGAPAAPEEDVYSQLMEAINDLTMRVAALEQGGVTPIPSTAVLGVAKLGSLKLA